MASISLTVNGDIKLVDVIPETPLLWVLRDTLRMTGTKFGCGRGLCGACTVHIDGEAAHSCITPVEYAEGKKITTIEGLARDPQNPLIRAWLLEEVSQCGYCQPGQIMTAAALIAKRTKPTDADINSAMSGNLCRCGTYTRIRRAIQRAATWELRR